MKNVRILTAVLAVLTAFNTNSFAVGSGGIANEVTSAEDLSNLLAITGSKTDPTATYHNPASVGDQGKSLTSLGLMYYNFSAEREGSNGTSDKMKTGNIVVPNFATTGSLGKWGFGLAVVSPYGLETEWSDTSNVRYVATKSAIKMMDITPAVSYRPSEKMAVGAGVDYFYTFDASLENKVPVDVVNTLLGFPTAGSPDANAKLEGQGHAWGYHGGLLFNPAKAHTLGLTYHSEVKTRINGMLELTNLSGASAAVFGGASYQTSAFTDLFYPQNVQMGYKYNRDDKWEAGINLAWYDWSANQELLVRLPSANATQNALAAKTVPLKWRDVWSGTVGGFYRFTDAWKLNMGAYYLPAVYPEETFSPAVPDMDKIGISVGPSYSKGAWGIDAVYNPLFYKGTSITNTTGQSVGGPDISGKYKAMVHIIGVNVKYKFQ